MAAGDVGMVVVAPAASFHHTHHHHHHHDAASNPDPIFPLLSAGPCVLDPDAAKAAAASSGIQFWQSSSSQHHQQQQQQSPPSGGNNPNPSLGAFYLKKPLPMLDTGGAGSSGSGTATCQDCGNQAKKDCSHSRCRTCCKSRGFDCSTHVKSTWVPAARRRERQHLGGSESTPGATASTAAAAASKKPRLLSSQQAATSHTSTSNATTPRSYDTTSSHQDPSFRGSLPRQVRAPAVFRCVRVTSVDDGEDEYAYQATVTINGHVFKGFLYDQGVDDGRASNDIDSTAGVPSMSDLHLGGGGNAGRGAGVPSSSMAPSDMYGGGGAAHQHILGGSGYGNTMN
ncbi:protein LATERAL ROOT PRIMORDIUM 1 [Lolium perenne]|uniref:protein LATERAL ROOT PRIMORDIUM 1 n=1 Tax=Lolium perenne TaxID=4522 RepID=UPI0021F5C754|nr:protein LATERAL ROOT PRIMORDIUM 1-like [Lolium perenne]